MLRKAMWPVLLLAVLVVALPSAGTEAQSRTVFWRNWDLVIDEVDAVDNRFDVSELYDVEFTGSFSFGSRVIERTNLSSISNVRVSQDGAPLRELCSEVPGTYCVSNNGSEYTITYRFFNAINNGDASFQIDYTVNGALRIYEGGDQLWWTVIPEEHFGFSIGSSTVTVQLPNGYSPREGVDPVVSYGAPTTVTVNGPKAVFETTSALDGNDYLEVRVQFPHNPDAVAPGWQSSFDDRRAFEETTQPIITLVALLLSLVVAIGGPLLVYVQWQRKGRDPQIGPVPEFLSEPPSDLPPAVVGSLLDEKADVRDVMSTLIDLGHRGYLVIEEEQVSGLFGFGQSSSFTFKRTDKPLNDLRPFEERVMSGVFYSRAMERSLDSLKNRFYTTIPRVQSDLYDELVREGLFTRSPQQTRGIWSVLGVGILGLTFVGIFVLAPILSDISPLLMCLPAAFGLTGLAVLVAGQFMPAKTRKGAEEAAKWNAFQEYLRNLEKYGDVEGAAANFDRYLPYAVAFGIDRTWMNKFRNVDQMPIPPWYFPTYMGGPYRRGYIPGSPVYRGGGFAGVGGSGMPGELARAPGAGMSMESLSNSMAVSMENLSNGLSSMMESATRAMTSQPQASSGSSGRWSGGGGSFSGGGGGGGGSSGGGSSGFG
jgi:uncharacterized membrane protein YgcG